MPPMTIIIKNTTNLVFNNPNPTITHIDKNTSMPKKNAGTQKQK